MKSDDSIPLEERRQNSLRRSVEICLQLYLQRLDGDEPSDIYRMVIHEAEHALVRTMLEHTGGNQSKAAEYLGITRGTLRKKLKQLGLDDNAS